MFGRKYKLFTLFGFTVHIDLSWLIIAALVTWALAQGEFRAEYKDLPPTTLWIMGIAGAIGLFASVIFHEMSHSLIARRFGIEMKGITLFVFGGVAEMGDEPSSPKAELLMALAGPAASVVASMLFFLVLVGGGSLGWRDPVMGVIQWLAWINLLLAAFNMLPGFPLDGGRVLRAILWMVKGDVRWATGIAAAVGKGFGAVLIGLGVLMVLRNNFIGGLWMGLIGFFVRGAAKGAYQQLLIREAFDGEPVRQFMNPQPVTVPPDISIRQLVQDYMYRYHYKMFPVTDGGRLLGCITTQDIKPLSPDLWGEHAVSDLAHACTGDNTVGPDENAMKVLGRMRTTGRSRLMVVEGDRLLGIVTLKDLLEYLSIRLELESGAAPAGLPPDPPVRR